MPHGNRVSSSSALKMTGIWTNTIGYDPYAAEGAGTNAEDEANAYEQAQGLMALAKLSNQGVSQVDAFYFDVDGLSCARLSLRMSNLFRAASVINNMSRDC